MKHCKPKAPRKPRQFRYVHRDAITGGFVTAAYAADHPTTTIRQRVRIAKPARSH